MIQNSNYILQKDLIYKITETEQLTLDIYIPKSSEKQKFPVAVHIHGGGWRSGNKNRLMNGNVQFVPDAMIAKRLLAEEIMVISINYRLTSVFTKYPLPITDCKDAFRWLVKNADQYRLDTNRMVVWGHSAGGHLSLMTGLTPAGMFPGEPDLAEIFFKVKGIVSMSGPTNLKSFENSTPESVAVVNLMGGRRSEQEREYTEASPITYIDSTKVPIFLVHGVKDEVVPVSQSMELYETSIKSGVRIKIRTVENADHSFKEENIQYLLEDITNEIVEFMKNSLNV